MSSFHVGPVKALNPHMCPKLLLFQVCLKLVSHLSKCLLCFYCCQVTSVISVQPHRWQRTRLPCSWDSPGKNAGVGCHFLLQCMKVKSESEVTQLYLTLHNSMDCSLPRSSVHGIFQARVLEWGAMAFSNACYRVTIINTFIIDMETLGEARYIIVNKW